MSMNARWRRGRYPCLAFTLSPPHLEVSSDSGSTSSLGQLRKIGMNSSHFNPFQTQGVGVYRSWPRGLWGQY